ncbi:MAG TPA: ImmA/IrrE family metallo-endopeptidase [Stellaceae bacterium]|jgi:plasmid maintenance system antidote protein VapI|nr:ImmA/IrrE family metallo-endopeptidase [Stellaceae bacterium]
MAEFASFQPQWASAPGGTILDILDQKGMSIEQFCAAMRTSEAKANKLLSGDAEIDLRIATKLEIVLGGSAAFWLQREAQYRSDVSRLNVVSSDLVDWAATLPLKDMISFGWIEKAVSRAAQAEAALQFFGSASVAAWQQSCKTTAAAVAYRTSPTYESLPEALAAWLRQGEIEAAEIECAPWDKDGLKCLIPELRKLTCEEDPAVFIPELQRLCSSCGVAVVVVRGPKGCRASGATRFISPTKAVIQLSFRFRTDDHLWFTFFHELGHLLLHDCSSMFLEETGLITTHEEDEANDFATSTLVPPEDVEEMLALQANHRQIMRFARRLGIAYGIVVGQLQHHGVLAHNQLNKLKVRYTWAAD